MAEHVRILVGTRKAAFIYTSANHAVWGPSVAKSTDGGKTWDNRSEDSAFRRI